MLQKSKKPKCQQFVYNKLIFIGVFIVFTCFYGCFDKNSIKKLPAGNLLVTIDTSLSSLKRVKDPQVFLKYLADSDSVRIRFLGLFDNESTTIETGNGLKDTLIVKTDQSTYFAKAITVSRKSNSSINIYYHDKLFVIPLSKQYYFIDVQTAKEDPDALEITYNNQILILS
jgi:hypothetical protein